jgi:hypothetical protein
MSRPIIVPVCMLSSCGSLVVAVVALALAAFAEVNRREAQAQRVAAETARNEAQTQRDRAERTLTLATGTANSLVFDLAQKFRDVVGVPASTIKHLLGGRASISANGVDEKLHRSNSWTGMSPSGHTRRFNEVRVMSVYAPIATV